MRVGVVTLHREINFGSALQAIALTRIINSLDHEAMLVDYTRGGRTGFGAFLYRLRTFDGPPLWRLVTAVVASFENGAAWAFRFRPFVRKNALHTSRYRGIRQLRKKPPKVDVLMTGSDQVWNPIYNEGVDPGFFLDFGTEQTRRVSYAASFGADSLPPETVPSTNRLLARYEHICVREIEGKSIVEQMGLSADVGLDPTLLLDAQAWRKLTDSALPPRLRRPYLLVYCVEDDRRAAVDQIAQEHAMANGWEVIQVSANGSADRVGKLRGYLRSDPGAFIELLDGASFVVTSSFHGTAFAITFEKEFISVQPPSYSSRVRGLLQSLGVEDHLVSTAGNTLLLNAIDFDMVRPVLKTLRANSLGVLRNMLAP